MTKLLEFETEIEFEGETYVVLVDVEADMEYTPGRVSGPPEDCYPPECECDITSLKIVEARTDGEMPVVAGMVEALNLEEIEDALWEKFEDDKYDSA